MVVLPSCLSQVALRVGRERPSSVSPGLLGCVTLCWHLALEPAPASGGGSSSAFGVLHVAFLLRLPSLAADEDVWLVGGDEVFILPPHPPRQFSGGLTGWARAVLGPVLFAFGLF